jgi:uncharacterized membrane protein YdjX (TVP38/TMEM64 family)
MVSPPGDARKEWYIKHYPAWKAQNPRETIPSSHDPGDQDRYAPPTPTGAGRWLSFIVTYVYPGIFVLVVMVCMAAAYYQGPEKLCGDMQALIDGKSKPVVAVILFLLITVVILLSMPLSPFLYMASGWYLGLFLGAAVNWAGTALGSFLCFYLTKKTLGPKLRNQLAFGPNMDAFLEVLEGSDSFKVLLLSRFAESPFAIKNIAPGMINIKSRDFAMAVIFGSTLYQTRDAQLGTVASAWCDTDANKGSNIWQEVLLGLTILATMLIMVYVAYLWKKQLRNSEVKPNRFMAAP